MMAGSITRRLPDVKPPCSTRRVIGTRRNFSICLPVRRRVEALEHSFRRFAHGGVRILGQSAERWDDTVILVTAERFDHREADGRTAVPAHPDKLGDGC